MKQSQVLNAFLLCLLFGSTGIVTAQTRKGAWFAEGNLGYINITHEHKYDEHYADPERRTNGYSITLYPKIGYFLGDHIAIGARVNLDYSSFSTTIYQYSDKVGTEKYHGGSIGINPFVRYYFTKNSKDRLYGELGLGPFNKVYSRNDGTSYDWRTGSPTSTYSVVTNGHRIFAEILIGFNHFFNSNIAFNSSIGYNSRGTTATARYSSSWGNGFEYETVINSGNVVWNFGFTILFGGKKAV